MKRFWCAIGVLCLFVAGAAGAEPPVQPPPLSDVLGEVGEGNIEAHHHNDVKAGKLVVTELVEASERELGVGAACLVTRSAAEVLAPFLADRPVGSPDSIEKVVRIPRPFTQESFAALSFGAGAREEATRYVLAEPGYGLNLADSEREAFHAIDPPSPELVAQVESALRRMLYARLSGYAQRGLDGTAGYARGRGHESQPARALHRSFHISPLLAENFPLFADVWNHYPHPELGEDDEEFFWSRARVEERPAFFLTHRVHRTSPSRGIVARRNFYISHFFDAGFEIAGVAATQEGSLFFFVRRVWVDRWNGMTAAKRAVGHRLIAGELRSQIEANRICR